MKKENIILGIDPGTNVMGYGVIREHSGKLKLLTLGVLKLGKYGETTEKLKKIFDRVSSLIEEFRPDVLSVESPFFGKNVQSMLKLGRAQGVAIAASINKDVPFFEYSPKKIKLSITGNGNASKEQVAAMLKTILSFTETPEFLDATDGLAAAVCHSFQKISSGKEKKYSGWQTFLSENPDKLIK